MGDSHPMLGLNPDSIPGAINLAGTSEYYFLSYLKLRKALESGLNKPEIIILPLDLHSFAAHGNMLLKQHELDDPFWSSQIDMQEIISSGLPADFTRWWISARFFPYAGQYYRLFARMFKNEAYALSAKGFAVVHTSFGDLGSAERKKAAEERYRAHFDKYNCFDTLQIQSLKNISNLCFKHKIRLMLVSFPLSGEYLHRAASGACTDSIRSLHRKIAGNAAHFDYSHLFQNNAGFFSDPNHLNAAGAAIFSALLRRDLENLRKKPVGAPEEI